MEPKQIQPLRVKADLEVMATGRYFFLRCSPELESKQKVQFGSLPRTIPFFEQWWGSFTPLRRIHLVRRWREIKDNGEECVFKALSNGEKDDKEKTLVKNVVN